MDVDPPGAGPKDGRPPSTRSVTDSILEYRRENGRTYHRYKEGSMYSKMFLPAKNRETWLTDPEYWAPNDEVELDRLGAPIHVQNTGHALVILG